MKVFVSWSGTLSQKVACALRDWIPCVLQYVRPYVSSEDIDKGTRWSVDIATELNDSAYGILCVTADNQGAPWLNFEAGALSKSIDKSFVTPFLLNLKAAELRNGPLIQFQAATFAQDEVRKLIESINNKASETERVEVATVKRTFEKWWPELEKDLRLLLEGAPVGMKPAPAQTKQESMLEELLDLTRAQQRHLGNPESLLPPDYIDWAVNRVRKEIPQRARLSSRLHPLIVKLVAKIEEIETSDSQVEALKLAQDLHSAYHDSEDREVASSRGNRIPLVEGVHSATGKIR